MSNYRRSRLPGGTYFFTANLQNRHSRLLVENIDPLRAAVRQVRVKRPFRIDAWVVLPEHMHCIWTMPTDDGDYPGRWKAIKQAFAKALPLTERRTATQFRRGERGIWQRRFWEHLIRDARDFKAHFDYVHFNPVKHGHVRRVADWPYSTFHRAVANGIYPRDWAGGMELDGPVGERLG